MLVGIVMVVYSFLGFVDWIASDPFDFFEDAPQAENYVDNIVYHECIDNDNGSFNQEYSDKKISDAFDKAVADNPNKVCSMRHNGDQGILGCTGDLFYSVICK